MRDSFYWEIIQTIHIQQLSQIHFQDEYCKVNAALLFNNPARQQYAIIFTNKDGPAHIVKK